MPTADVIVVGLGAHGSSAGDPEDIWFGEWVAQERLEGGARHGQAPSDQDREHDSGQPDEDDDVPAGRVSSADECPQDLARGVRDGPEAYPEENREAEHHEENRPEGPAIHRSVRPCISSATRRAA